MKNSSIITLLNYAQQEQCPSFKSKETEEAFDTFYKLSLDFISELKDNNQLLKLYYKLDDAKNFHMTKIEDDAYYIGFKTGFKLALELELIEF